MPPEVYIESIGGGKVFVAKGEDFTVTRGIEDPSPKSLISEPHTSERVNLLARKMKITRAEVAQRLLQGEKLHY